MRLRKGERQREHESGGSGRVSQDGNNCGHARCGRTIPQLLSHRSPEMAQESCAITAAEASPLPPGGMCWLSEGASMSAVCPPLIAPKRREERQEEWNVARSCSAALCAHQEENSSGRKVFSSTPRPEMVISTLSPGESGPTPEGVPVRIRSPGSSVKNDEI